MGTTLTAQNTCATALPAAEGLNTYAALTGGGASNVCFGGGATNAAWYTYTPAENGQLSVYSCGTTDSRLSVYSGSCAGLVCEDSNDDAGMAYPCQTGGFAAGIGPLNVIGGVTYFIEWDDRWSSLGVDWTLGFVGGVPGCTDPAAPNYDPNATDDDGSCLPACADNVVVLTLIDSFGDGWNGAIYTITDLATSTVVSTGTLPNPPGDELELFLCLPDGCYNLVVTGGTFPVEVGWTLAGVDGGPLSGGANVDLDFSINNLACSVFGCVNPLAINYDMDATDDDGSCIVPTCVDPPLTVNLCYDNSQVYSFYYEPLNPGDEVIIQFLQGTVESSVWDQLVIYDGDNVGAPVLFANPTITIQLADLALQSTLGNGILITLSTDGSFSCATTGTFIPWQYEVYCGNPVLSCGALVIWDCGFDPDSPEYEQIVLDDPFCCNVEWDGFCQEAYELIGGLPNPAPECGPNAGCIDPLATNYDPGAAADDGSCQFCNGDPLLQINMTDNLNVSWSGATYTIVNVANGTTVASGSLETALTGNPFSNGTDLACIAPGCYLFNVSGGTFPAAIGWSITDNFGNFYGDGSGNVSNFPLAVFDGDCGFQGCTDEDALNYAPSASVDDGSCIFPPANDLVCNATAVQCGETYPGSLDLSSDDEGLIGTVCGTVPVESGGVWYEFNPASDQQVTASTCNAADGDTKIHVFVGAPDCTNLVCLGGNDDGVGCANFTSEFTFAAQTGFNYFIYVSQFTFGGVFAPAPISFDLSITCTDCLSGVVSNDVCADATPLISEATVNTNSCCMNASGAPNFVAGAFATAYDQFFVFNTGTFDSIELNVLNVDGQPIAIMFYDGDCNTLDDLGATVFFVGQAILSGTVLANLFGGPLQPNTDYYFSLFTLTPDECGSLDVTVTGINFGCTDPTATNFDPTANENDGSCDYTGVTPDNDDCTGAIVLGCDDSIIGSTGGGTGGTFVSDCLPGSGTVSCAVAPPAGVDPGSACYESTVLDDPFCCETGWDAFCQGFYDACAGGCGIEVWYQFVGTGDIVTFSACGSEIAAGVAVYESTDCNGPFTPVAPIAESEPCDFFNADDDSPTILSDLGTNYFVVVTSSSQGTFQLDVTCVEAVIACTNPVAYNYNPLANIDSGDCDFFSETCVGNPAGVPVQLLMWDNFGDGWNDATYSITDGFGTVVASGDIDAALYSEDENNFVGAEFGFDLLCLDEACFTITVGGGTWDAEISWSIVDELGNEIIGAGTPVGGGGAGVFDFIIGNAVCGCTNDGACNFNPDATSEDGSCEFETCAGCTDISACNYDADATIDDGSCCFENCVTINLNDISGGFIEIYTIDGTLAASLTGSGGGGAGCAADPGCDADPNSAQYATVTTNDPFCCNTTWDFVCQNAYLGIGGQPNPACLGGGEPDPNVFCLSDGCYYVVSEGATWTIFGVNGGFIAGAEASAADFVTFSVGAITCLVGCAEPIACNYDPAATVPDCSLCEYASCLGCTYEEGMNYDPAATIDDGSCDIQAQSDCPADLNGDGLINAVDLSIFLGSFGTTCP